MEGRPGTAAEAEKKKKKKKKTTTTTEEEGQETDRPRRLFARPPALLHRAGPVAEVAAGPWKIQSPFRIEIVGPSGSGKSTLILKLIGDDSVYDRPFRRVNYCCPTLSDRREYLEELEEAALRGGKELLLTEGLPDKDRLLAQSRGEPALVVLDDLPMMENLSGLDALVGMFSRHHDLSLVLAVQNHFLKKRAGADFAFISRNLSGIFVLANRADALQLSLLNARLCPERKGFLRRCLEDAVSRQGCPYLWLDLHPQARYERRLMASTRIFASERAAGGRSPVFYLLTPGP